MEIYHHFWGLTATIASECQATANWVPSAKATLRSSLPSLRASATLQLRGRSQHCICLALAYAYFFETTSLLPKPRMKLRLFFLKENRLLFSGWKVTKENVFLQVAVFLLGHLIRISCKVPPPDVLFGRAKVSLKHSEKDPANTRNHKNGNGEWAKKTGGIYYIRVYIYIYLSLSLSLPIINEAVVWSRFIELSMKPNKRPWKKRQLCSHKERCSHFVVDDLETERLGEHHLRISSQNLQVVQTVKSF